MAEEPRDENALPETIEKRMTATLDDFYPLLHMPDEKIKESALGKGAHALDEYMKSHQAELVPDGACYYSAATKLDALLLFFAERPNLNPQDEAFTTESANQLIGIFRQMVVFDIENGSDMKGYQRLVKFINATKPFDEECEETRQVLNCCSVIPAVYSMLNHKLVNKIPQCMREMEDQDCVDISVDVSRRGAKNVVTSACHLTYDSNRIKIDKTFNEFDRAVYNAVSSLWIAGNRVMTSAMIWRTLNGKIDTEEPTLAETDEISASIDKMRCMLADIDCTEELKMRRISADVHFKDNLLHAEEITQKINGITAHAYRLLTEPLLMRYSSIVGQVITVPIDTLNMKKLDAGGKITTRSANYSKRQTVIKEHIIRRIALMKNKKNHMKSRRIALYDSEKDEGYEREGLYTVAGCPELSQPMPEGASETDKTKRKNDARCIRDEAKLVLENLKQTKKIKDYTTYRGRTTGIAGFEIIL